MDILENTILILLIASSFIVIISIILLPPKESSMGTAIGGSGDTGLFGKKKSHGATAVLERLAIASSTVFMLSAFIYNVLLKYI